MNKNLFLDDERNPKDAIKGLKLDPKVYGGDWDIVRTFKQFKAWITSNGVPNKISFDHDLGGAKSGYDCAKFLKEYCDSNSADYPTIYVHSMNPVGKQNILNLFK